MLAAVRDAWDAAVDLQQRQLGALGGGFGGAPGGFDLSSLGLPSLGGGLTYEADEDDEEDDEDLDDDEEDDDLDDEDRPAARRTMSRGRSPTSTRTSTPMYEGVIQDLIDELGRLPGVGPKGAQRIAFHLLAADPEDVRRLAAALDRGDRARPVLQDLRQRRRGRGVPDLP